MSLIGIDVAHWQGVVPWEDVARSGVQYAWIKATHGLSSTTDKQFARNWQASRGVLPRGAYHWLTDADPVTQAERVVSVLEAAGDLGELLISVDFEEPGTHLRGVALVDHVRACLNRVHALTGGAVIYTGAWYWSGFALDVDAADIVERFPLWHAQYPRTTLVDKRACAAIPPVLPRATLSKPWASRGVDCAVWQFDGDGSCVLPNGVDADFNMATDAGFARVLRRLPDTEPAPPPDSAPTWPGTAEARTRSSQRLQRVVEPLGTFDGTVGIVVGDGEHTINLDDEPEDVT